MGKIQVVILGRNYTSLLGMIRAVGEIDCEITVIKSVRKLPKKSNIKYIFKRIIFGKPIEFTSKYVKKYLYTIEPNREYLINLLLNNFNDFKENVIIIPTDDFTASTIDLYQEKLKEKFLFPNILHKHSEIIRLMDKKIQKEIAIENDLEVAKSWIIKKENNKYSIPNDITYPVFLKPLISFKGNKNIMKKCKNKEEIEEILKNNMEYIDGSILVEQYINIEKEYAILGCSYNGEVIIPSILEMLASGTGSHKGVTLKGKIYNFKKMEEKICNNLERFIKSLNFDGLFDIDLYESNGIVYFNELNLRFGASGYAVTKTGVNLPKIFIFNLLNKKNQDSYIIEEKTFVNEKVNLEEYEAGTINFNQYKKNIEESDICFINSSDDIKPYKSFKKMEKYIKFKKMLKNR